MKKYLDIEYLEKKEVVNNYYPNNQVLQLQQTYGLQKENKGILLLPVILLMIYRI